MLSEDLPIWESYAAAPDTTESDKRERPPLTGKDRYIPAGLYDLPWSSATDAYGKATLTPYYIEALTSDDEGDVAFGAYGLYSATTHQGSVYKASFLAIPFLVDLLKLGGAAADMACHFLARIALGEHHFISAPCDVYHTKYFRSVNKYRKELLTYYKCTGSEEAMRLLCFLPGMLPDRLDFSRQEALRLTGDERTAYARQASALVAQGFLAAERNYAGKGYPAEAAEIDPNNLKVAGHLDAARALLRESPSLLVRGSAAICLAYSGVVDDEVLGLLEFLGEQELTGVPWVWDDFSTVARKAWMFSADLDTLIDSDGFLTLDHTTYSAEGVAQPQYSPSERLTVAAGRLFPERYAKQGQNPPLLPADYSAIQKKALRRIIGAAPGLLGSYQTAGLNIPMSAWAARRMLGESDELLCTEMDGIPLWYRLETSVLENTPAGALPALCRVDVWQLLGEIYRPVCAGKIEEKCSLSLRHDYDDKKTAAREELLQSILADALAENSSRTAPFLDQWLGKAATLADYDWKFKAPGQRIGICLLSLARSGQWDDRYEPLARPYHPVARFSNFAVPLLREVLAVTSPKHQQEVMATFHIK